MAPLARPVTMMQRPVPAPPAAPQERRTPLGRDDLARCLAAAQQARARTAFNAPERRATDPPRTAVNAPERRATDPARLTPPARTTKKERSATRKAEHRLRTGLKQEPPQEAQDPATQTE